MSAHGITIRQSGGISTFYVVSDTATGKVLHVGSPSLFGDALATKLWCWRHGYGWPTAAQMNG